MEICMWFCYVLKCMHSLINDIFIKTVSLCMAIIFIYVFSQTGMGLHIVHLLVPNLRPLILGSKIPNFYTNDTTKKFLNFWTQKKFAIIYLKIKQRPNIRVFCLKYANGIANIEDLDQADPLFAMTYLSENL